MQSGASYGPSLPPVTGARSCRLQAVSIRGADEDPVRKQRPIQALVRGLALRRQRYSGVLPIDLKFGTCN